MELINLIKNGRTNVKLQQNAVPSISVIDRLVVVILSNNLENQYNMIMQEGCIEACLDLLENGTEELQIKKQYGKYHLPYRQDAFDRTRQHFSKFETIAMQAISLLFNDNRAEKWPRHLLHRICSHSLRIIYKWSERPFKAVKRKCVVHRMVPQSTSVQCRQCSTIVSKMFDPSALIFALTIIIKGLRNGIFYRPT